MDIYAFRLLGHLLASPIYHTALIFVITGIICKCWSRIAFLRRPIWSICCAWLVLCSQPFFSQRLLAPLENYAPSISSDAKQLANSSATFILACYVNKEIPLPETSGWSECSLQRLVQGAIIYHQHKTPIYITGGNFLTDSAASYTQLATRFLIALGVSPEHIVAIAKGTNTLEEMTAAYTQLPAGQINIVSSATHMHRIALFHQYLTNNASQDSASLLLMPPTNTNKESIVMLPIPVDHIITRQLSTKPALPVYYSIENTERALYEYIAIITHKLTR